MNPLIYAAILLIPGLAVSGIIAGGLWTFAAPFLVFVLIPLGELVWPLDHMANYRKPSAHVRTNPWIDFPIYAAVAAHFGLLTLFLIALSSGAYSSWETAGIIASLGMSCGAIAINLGHELGHRLDPADQRLAKVLLCSTLYVHFFIEHNRGHHVRVATSLDPATAQRNVTLYRFLPRSILGGWISAWKLEWDRLAKRNQRALGLANEMLRWQFMQLAFVATIGLSFGLLAMVAFCGASLIGACLLESINYLEHYGLVRERSSDGRLEPVRPEHSWNSNSFFGRVFLFELPRHSDHHARPKRTYSTLRHIEDAPQLPTGYPGMILLSLVPPAYFAVMNARLDAREQPTTAAA